MPWQAAAAAATDAQKGLPQTPRRGLLSHLRDEAPCPPAVERLAERDAEKGPAAGVGFGDVVVAEGGEDSRRRVFCGLGQRHLEEKEVTYVIAVVVPDDAPGLEGGAVVDAAEDGEDAGRRRLRLLLLLLLGVRVRTRAFVWVGLDDGAREAEQDGAV